MKNENVGYVVSGFGCTMLVSSVWKNFGCDVLGAAVQCLEEF